MLFLPEKAHFFLPGRMGKQGIISTQSLTELGCGWFATLVKCSSPLISKVPRARLVLYLLQASPSRIILFDRTIMQTTTGSHLCKLKFLSSHTEKRFKKTVENSCNNVFNSIYQKYCHHYIKSIKIINEIFQFLSSSKSCIYFILTEHLSLD